ncbi:Rossmann fold nucleotide-binding protein Smf possibly involved in DNA uptake [Microbacterium esteraromaticum]|uniref:Rossmann fold nucleotide-binding protein Smf possibly involved in DNA uptake n=1 Tax=Microbacterium esteraromaticum TaxID=57043 RepID=A0A1R4K5F5_9MICO|nr:DNA-processing protein DprA [Microbacterium esteraromaticum]SJN39499.1 Rossmann fold nucleotide-binding protein Smf possibly involved in DNA uptake [Microbacterium esteraromaticum]
MREPPPGARGRDLVSERNRCLGLVDRPLSAERADLRAGGGLSSEVAPDATPTKWRFLSRNRVIAATAAATIVIESGWRSGTHNIADHAASLGRGLGTDHQRCLNRMPPPAPQDDAQARHHRQRSP